MRFHRVSRNRGVNSLRHSPEHPLPRNSQGKEGEGERNEKCKMQPYRFFLRPLPFLRIIPFTWRGGARSETTPSSVNGELQVKNRVVEGKMVRDIFDSWWIRLGSFRCTP